MGILFWSAERAKSGGLLTTYEKICEHENCNLTLSRLYAGWPRKLRIFCVYSIFRLVKLATNVILTTMKKIIYGMIAMSFLTVIQAETEVWYNWQGQRVGEMAAESPGKTQPQDLVMQDQALVRMAVEPWNAPRRFRRLGDWYRDGYSGWNAGYGWGGVAYPHYYRYSYRTCAPRQGLQLWYRNGGNWGVNYRSPGLSVRWHY
jgi:hypothetical protein